MQQKILDSIPLFHTQNQGSGQKSTSKVHSTIGRYETHTAIKWEARMVTAMDRV